MYNLQYEPWMSKLLTVNDHCRSIMIYPETWTYIQSPPTAWESWKQNLFEHSLRTKKPSNCCATKTIPNNICQANPKKNKMKRCLVLNVSKLRNIPPKKLCRKKKAHETASFDGFWFFQGQKFTVTCDRKSAWDFCLQNMAGDANDYPPKSPTLNLTSISQELQDCSTSRWHRWNSRFWPLDFFEKFPGSWKELEGQFMKISYIYIFISYISLTGETSY